jgi:uncharacterized membrane-anchored protein YjiN (DUF445 family)
MRDAGRTSPDARRARDLARIQAIATGLLAVMAVVFVLASRYQLRWPGLAYVRAFSEAGMVGACADWFAVTALFRHPFGLPIPHTAVVPRNKDRIGEALGGFIAENFLTEAVLQDKLRALEVGRWGGAWLRRPANARRLAVRIAVVLPEVIEAAPKGALGDLARSALLAAARATPAAPMAGRILDRLWREGYGDEFIDRGLELAAGYLGDHKDMLRERIAETAESWLSRWIDRLLVGRMIEALLRTLEEMRAPEHRLRRQLNVIVRRWIRRLRTDAELRARVEQWKLQLLSHPALQAQLEEAQHAVEARIADEIAADRRGLAQRLERAIRALGDWLAEASPARDQLNAWARELVTGVIAPRRRQIGRFVAEVVAGWEAQSVTEKLELQVGKDLQYIRINGTLVGGLVGVLIFAVARATGLN